MKTKTFTLGVLILSSNALFSQTYKVNKVEELKTYALSVCIQNNYKRVDSTFQSRDMTGSFIIVDLVPIAEEQRGQFKQFINEKTGDFYLPVPYQESSIKDANSICYKCIDFYKSKELMKFVKKLLKQTK